MNYCHRTNGVFLIDVILEEVVVLVELISQSTNLANTRLVGNKITQESLVLQDKV